MSDPADVARQYAGESLLDLSGSPERSRTRV